VPIFQNDPFLVKLLHPLTGFHQVSLIDDIVAVKDAPGFMAGNHHGYPLRDPRPDHVPYRYSSEVME